MRRTCSELTGDRRLAQAQLDAELNRAFGSAGGNGDVLQGEAFPTLEGLMSMYMYGDRTAVKDPATDGARPKANELVRLLKAHGYTAALRWVRHPPLQGFGEVATAYSLGVLLAW